MFVDVKVCFFVVFLPTERVINQNAGLRVFCLFVLKGVRYKLIR